MSKKKPKVAELQMKPTTATTGFGTGVYDPKTGNVGYTLAEPLAGMRDEFYGAADEFLPSQEQELFAQQVGDYGRGLFADATNYDIDQMTSDYYNRQQDILRPDRDIEQASLQDRLFGTGRTGYGTGTDGGYINPQQYALQRARMSADAQLALGAEDRARGIQSTDISRGLGMMDVESSLRMNPYQQASTLFGIGTGIEGLGFQNLNTVAQFAPMQMQWQQAQQANQQAQNNAKASGGLGGLFGGLVNAGLNYATGGMSGGLGSFIPGVMDSGASWFTGGISDATSMAGGVGKESWMYSDADLKTNIRKIGEYKNGLNKYSYSYVWGQEGVGVLAQEAMAVVPKAVRYNNGYLQVNYDLIGD